LIAERRAWERSQQHKIAVDERPAEVGGDDLGDWEARALADEAVQLRLLSHHPPLVEKEAGVIPWSDPQHEAPLVAVHPE
jgi:hypothetical protein